MDIKLTQQQLEHVENAVSKNKPKLLYKLFANIVSSQFYHLNELTDYDAMMYLYNNHKMY